MTELESIASELKGIKNILASLWQSKYNNDETNLVSPDFYADEYITIEEASKRLGVSDQTIRNWILQGKKGRSGWIQGIHYIIIPSGSKKQIIRIPWNQVIHSFRKTKEVTLRSFDSYGTDLYTNKGKRNLDYVPDPSKPDVSVDE
jgi:hypothetical protein|tara:strand:- start:2649 stop:3086 length:438 start_codon:yes stop_codon:yes gene_type:complete